MKVLGKFLTSVLAIGLLAGCNNHPESLDKPGFVDDGEPLYMSVNLQLPVGMAGTRSQTIDPDENGDISNGGHENGQDFENTVQTVLLVLAENGTDNYIAHKLTGRIEKKTDGKLTITAPIDKTSLGRYYERNRVAGETGDEVTLAQGKEVIRVYAYCNPPQDLLDAFSGIGTVAEKETAFDNEWLHFACEIGQISTSDNRTVEKEEGTVDSGNQSVWARNSFLMSSTSVYQAPIPQKYSAWDEYSTAANPFLIRKQGSVEGSVTPISVERTVARFDFKDGSPNGDNTYDVMTTGAEYGKLQVKLVRMSLVNMSRHFYYLKHVTEGPNWNSDIFVCSPETIDNWVVDTDWKEHHKSAERGDGYALDLSEVGKFYNFSLFSVTDANVPYINEETRAQWNNHRIETVLQQQKANDDYHIWRYVTENTIPNRSHQTYGISTGVVFKGKLLAKKMDGNTGENTDEDEHAVNKDLLAAINGEYQINKDGEGNPIGYTYQIQARDKDGKPLFEEDGKTPKMLTYPILYQFNDVLYVGWNHQIKPLLEDPKEQGSLLYEAATKIYNGEKSAHDFYQDLVKVHNEGGDVTEALAKFRKAATAAGFTLYQASDDVTQGSDTGFGPGYYFYYYYWNRHNDNGRTDMGQMEFGVVRNNIYKLSVRSIKSLGHPRISDNDPDKPTPETPDEDAKVYLEVAVEVRPWTVRVNEIDF